MENLGTLMPLEREIHARVNALRELYLKLLDAYTTTPSIYDIVPDNDDGTSSMYAHETDAYDPRDNTRWLIKQPYTIRDLGQITKTAYMLNERLFREVIYYIAATYLIPVNAPEFKSYLYGIHKPGALEDVEDYALQPVTLLSVYNYILRHLKATPTTLEHASVRLLQNRLRNWHRIERTRKTVKFNYLEFMSVPEYNYEIIQPWDYVSHGRHIIDNPNLLDISRALNYVFNYEWGLTDKYKLVYHEDGNKYKWEHCRGIEPGGAWYKGENLTIRFYKNRSMMLTFKRGIDCDSFWQLLTDNPEKTFIT